MFSLGGAVCDALPGRALYGAAGSLGDLGFVLNRGARRQAIENYAGILGLPTTHPAVHRVARQALRGYTKLMADFLLLSRLGPEQVLQRVDVEGIENMYQALRQGRGVVVVTPHFGNWDIAAAAACALGLPVSAVADHYGDEELNSRVVASRARFGMKVIPLDRNAGRGVIKALRNNEIVALVCDLPKEGRNFRVDLCGQAAMVPAGPAVLALRSGAPVVPILCRRLPDDRYRLVMEPPVEFAPSGDRDRDEPALAQAIIDRFNPALRATPEQWYLFSPMWGLAA
ncbi:MAG: lysophospholipid acyltransferase family protein [Candidatus Dormibacteria bacterium]